MAKVGILGAGLTGLSLRYSLRQECEILEKESSCGGLCRSIKQDGFVFDQGGHIFFSQEKNILDFVQRLLGKNVEKRKRNNKVYYDQRLIKYPFENGLSGLSQKDNFACLYYYLNNQSRQPRNFKEWLYFNFGKGITEKYLIPYNRKIWKYDLKQMGMEWVARIPKPPPEDIIKSSLGIETEGYLHQLFYLYPKAGGIQSLTCSLEAAKDDAIRTNFNVSRISKAGKKWVVSDGKEERVFNYLVSTIPIFDLMRCLGKVPKSVFKSLQGLKFNSALIVLLGLNTDNLGDYTAIYFSDKDALYHRVCFMHNFSPLNAPKGKSALIAEITTRGKNGLSKIPEKQLVERVGDTLNKQGIIDKKDICLARVHRMQYAYIIYDRNYCKNISVVRRYVQDQGIYLCGRFSEFEYINMDEAIRRGMHLAERLNQK